MIECPSIEAWEALVAGRSPPEELAQLRSHADRCAECGAALERVRENLRVAGAIRTALAESGGPGIGPVLSVVGSAFDGFNVTRVLGSGSSATVYEAIQGSTGRRVAIKVLSAFAMTEQHLRRFEHEARILTRLHHPGIAHVYGTGVVTDDAGSRPYIAMELVDGKPITEHAADRALDPLARIRLLADACDAIHHAHERGVVHRDIKPANVLVTPEGSVRVVDFGFARLMAPHSIVSTMHTAHGQILGTVAYMSPEHIASADGVDARSDVYGLGVIGYELVTGRLPVAVRDLPLEGALRAIATIEPERPSRIDPALAGDVEIALLRALSKRPNDRYQSAGEFSADLRRIAAGMRIGARRPSAIDRARRFTRRHRALVAGAAAVVGSLLLGLAGTTWGLVQAIERTRVADHRRRNAEELARLMEQMLREAHPHEAKGRGYTVRQMLDDFSNRFVGGLADQPEVEASLRATMGSGYRVLGEYPLARSHLERALALRRAADPPVAHALGDSLCDLACLEHDEGAYDAAIGLFLEALGTPGIDGAMRIRALLGWSDCLRHTGDHASARRLGREALQEALAHRDRWPGAADSALAVAEARINLSRIERDAGEHDVAERELQEALQVLRTEVGEDDPRMADALNDAAWLAYLRRDLEAAESAARAAMETGLRTLGEHHPDVGNSKYELGLILASRNDAAMGEALVREALTTYVAAHGKMHPSTFTAQEALARVVRARGRPEEARDLLERVLEGRRAVFGPRNVEVAYALSALGQVLRDLGDLDSAEASSTEAIAIYREVFDGPHPFIANAQATLAGIAMDRGSAEDAERWHAEAVATMEHALGPTHADTLGAMASLAACRESRERWEQALESYEQILARCIPSTPPVRPALAHQGRGRCLIALGRREEGVEALRRALAALEAAGPASPPMDRRIALAREELARAERDASSR